MKNKIILLPFFIFLLISCNTTKEIKTDAYFNKWQNETIKILKKKTSNKIENALKEIGSFEFCGYYKNESNKNVYKPFPKLKYFLMQEKINVTVIERLKGSILLAGIEKNTTKPTFDIVSKDSLYENLSICNETHLQPLIVTKPYQKKMLGKLKYGFGSVQSGENKDNAKAILESHHSSTSYKIPYNINMITFNKAIDSAVVETSSTYNSYLILYTKKSDSWQTRKEISHLVE
jgi:hypothetical protein